MKKNKIKYLYLYAITLVFLATMISRLEAKNPPEKGKWVEKEFFNNGQIKLYQKYHDGKLTRRRTFYRNGRLLLDYVYRKGIVISKRHFYENGKIKSIWTRKSGMSKHYDIEGSLILARPTNNKNAHVYKPSYLFSGP